MAIYTGRPKTGKTTLALAHWGRIAVPAGLIIDSVGAKNFILEPHAETMEEIARLLYGDPPRHAIFTPHDTGEFIEVMEGLARASRAGHTRPVLIDEVWRWVYPWPDPKIIDIFVAHRHRLRESAVLCTCTYLGHIRSDLINTADHVYIFAQQVAASFERIEREYGIPRDRLPTFPPPGRFIHWP